MKSPAVVNFGGFFYSTGPPESFLTSIIAIHLLIFQVGDSAIGITAAAAIFDSRLKPTIDNDFPPWSRTSGDFHFWPLPCLFVT
jgi:hypothetical protein